MSIAGTGGVLVEGPAHVPARYGLLSVAELVDDPDGHWLTGVLNDVEACDDLTIHSACPVEPMPNKEDDATSYHTNHSDPFFLVAGFKCSTVGMTRQRAHDIAGRRLSRGENRGLERAFWNGLDAGGNALEGSLTQNPDVLDITPVSGAIDLTSGVAMLESAMGDCYPGTAVLHANRGVATYLAERMVLEDDNGVQRFRATGSSLVVGGGYNITGPVGNAHADPASGEGWMFATGAIKVLRGPTAFVPELPSDPSMVDRVINNYTVFAERPYDILLDCCIFAVRVQTVSCC